MMDSFYVTIITMSTVGYGDITPQTTMGRLVIIGFLFLVLILLPELISRLTAVLHLRNGLYLIYGSHPHSRWW